MNRITVVGVLGLVAASFVLGGASCDPQKPIDPGDIPAHCLAYVNDPGALLQCVAGGAPRPRPEPAETATPDPTATATPHPTPAPTATSTATPSPVPTEGAVRIDPVPCERVFLDGTPCTLHACPGRLHTWVANAMRVYRDQHPARFIGNKLISPNHANDIDFYFGVVANLRAAGFRAVVDDCETGICGEIAVAERSSTRGKGWHEQYHVLTSGDMTGADMRLDASSYRATCTPAGF